MHAWTDKGWPLAKPSGMGEAQREVVVPFEAGGLDAVVEGEFKDMVMPNGTYIVSAVSSKFC